MSPTGTLLKLSPSLSKDDDVKTKSLNFLTKVENFFRSFGSVNGQDFYNLTSAETPAFVATKEEELTTEKVIGDIKPQQLARYSNTLSPELLEKLLEYSTKITGKGYHQDDGKSSDSSSLSVNVELSNTMFNLLSGIYSELGLCRGKGGSGKLLLLKPCFGYYASHAEKNGVDIEFLETENGIIDPEKLDNILKENADIKAFLFNYPNNPCGTLLTKDNAEAIAKILSRHKYVTIISDDIFFPVCYDGENSYHLSQCKNEYPDITKNMILLNGLSKIGAAGLGIGWAIIPKNMFPESSEELEGGPAASFFGHIPNLLCQQVAYQFLTSPKLQTFIGAQMQHYRENLEDLKKDKPHCIKLVTEPKGTNVCLLDFSGLKDLSYKDKNTEIVKTLKTDLDVAEFLFYYAGIALVHGNLFFIDENKMQLRITLSMQPNELKKCFGKFDSLISKLGRESENLEVIERLIEDKPSPSLRAPAVSLPDDGITRMAS